MYLLIVGAVVSLAPSTGGSCCSPLAVRTRRSPCVTCMSNEYESRNFITALLGNLLPKSDTQLTKPGDVLDTIDWAAPKARGRPIDAMCVQLDAGLREREWFVTGRVLPELFSDAFTFKDPDVQLKGIEPYARQVNRLFDQQTARTEVVTCRVSKTESNTINVVWRLSGRVNLGPAGVDIKPYVVTTKFQTNPNDGLIDFQEDTFDLPGWDIILSAFFPFLRPLLAPEAPPVEQLRAALDSEH